MDDFRIILSCSVKEYTLENKLKALPIESLEISLKLTSAS